MNTNCIAMDINSLPSDQAALKALWGNLLCKMDEQALLRNIDYARKRVPGAGLEELLQLVKYYSATTVFSLSSCVSVE